MKSFAEARMDGGESMLVVDLVACSGMDSTFMGTMAGMASRLAAIDGGAMQVAGANERNRRSLEDLGLDFLMQINPEDAAWKDRLEEIRSSLTPAQVAAGTDPMQRARQVLQAHEVLSDLNEKNARDFDQVVGTLRQQITDEPQSDS